MEMDLNRRLIDVSVGEAFELLKPQFADLMRKVVDEAVAFALEEKEVYGLEGIQKILGNCSKSKAQMVKNSGVIDAAITQNGRKIIVDVKKAKELLKKASLI